VSRQQYYASVVKLELDMYEQSMRSIAQSLVCPLICHESDHRFHDYFKSNFCGCKM